MKRLGIGLIPSDTIKSVFFGLLLLFLILVYIVVFGDAGLIVRHKLKDREKRLKEDIENLQKENRLLYTRYNQLTRQKQSKEVKEKNEKWKQAVIIQFDESGFKKKTIIRRKHGDSLIEIRITYIILSLLVIGFLHYLLFKFSGFSEEEHKNP